MSAADFHARLDVVAIQFAGLREAFADNRRWAANRCAEVECDEAHCEAATDAFFNQPTNNQPTQE